MLSSFLSGSWGARLQAVAGLAQRVPTIALSAAAGGVGSGMGPPRQPVPGAPPVPLARWMAMHSHDGVAGAPSAVPEARAQPPAVLVKVGGAGLYSLVKFRDMMGMDRMALLDALASFKGFAPDLAGVALQRCAVRVCASASNKAPSAPEVAASCELEGAETLGALTAAVPPNTNLFVCVMLPDREATTDKSE